MQKLSPNQPVYIDMAQERSQYFEHKHLDFLTLPQEHVELNKLTEKKLGSPAILRIFSKTVFSYSNTY